MWIICLALFLSATLGGFAVERETIQGVTISAQTWGTEWETPEMAAAMNELKSLGANAIAIHPYARIQADGSLRFDQESAPSYITRPLDWAHERGLKVMLIPHIAYWGSPFLWRGEIDFKNPSEWNRFFEDYERWITRMAKIAEDHRAGIFCIGLEYTQAQKFEARWRRIIAKVREVYHGKITYGSNWDGTEQVRFWDALDYIGVLAYYPLTPATDPTPEQLAAGWRPWMKKLEDASKEYGKQVLFTEIGYDESALCAAKPWSFHDRGGPNAVAIQARCIEQGLKLPGQYPFLVGMFFWKWFPNLPCPEVETFDLRRPTIKRLFSKYWTQPTMQTP